MSDQNMYFACTVCGWERQFGNGNSPENHWPVLKCDKCNAVTLHRYTCWKWEQGKPFVNEFGVTP